MAHTRTTVEDIPSKPYRALELLLFAFPLGLGAVALVATVNSAWLPVFAAGVLLASVVVALVASVLLYLDAMALRAIDIEWQPRPWLYAVLGLLFSGLTILHYLYTRQEHVVDRERRSWWWAVGAVLLVGGALVLLVGLSSISVPVAAATALLALFPVAIYKDATYVRLHGDWRPNPTMQFTLAVLFGSLFFLLAPLYGLYYYGKRYRSVGL